MERLIAPGPAEVERARDDLLAGSALAGDEDATPRVGDPSQQREDLAHRHALPEQVPERPGLVDRPAQPDVLLLEASVLEGATEDGKYFIALERLGHVVESAGVHGFDRRVDAAEGGHQHDGSRGQRGAQLAQQFQPALAGHLDVGQHHIGWLGEGARESGVGGRRAPGLDVVILEQRDEHLAHRLVVIDHKRSSSGFHTPFSLHVRCQPADAPRGPRRPGRCQNV